MPSDTNAPPVLDVGHRPPEPSTRRGLSILAKLVGLMAALVVLLVGSLAIYFPARQMQELRAAASSKAATYGRLARKQLEPAVAFDDRQTAREVFEAISEDTDVSALSLLREDGSELETRGQIADESRQLAKSSAMQQLRELPDRIVVVAPVVSLEGPKGMVVLELSTEALVASRDRLLRAALLVGLLALSAGVLVAWLIGRSLATRIRAISTVATRVAGGDLEQRPVHDPRADELGALATAFNMMLAQIRAYVTEIKESARQEQERLEVLVRRRTSELDERNRDMRLLLDNVDQGFLTIDLEGRLSRERSAVVEAWLGPVPEGARFGDYVDRIVPGFRDQFLFGWVEVVADVLPIELTLFQLPSGFRSGERLMALDYRPIFDEAQKLARVLIVISDVTEKAARELAERDERELSKLFSRILEDRNCVADFLEETQRLIGEICNPTLDATTLKRAVHTLKGNALLFGVTSLSSICEQIENKFAEGDDVLASDSGRLATRFEQLADKVNGILQSGGTELHVEPAEHNAVISAVDAGVPRYQIRRMLKSWKLEPIERRLRRFAMQVEVLAQRLGKGPVEVRIDANCLRVRPEQFAGFWTSFGHVVRNAVDHGLESLEERQALGKPAVATVWLGATMTETELSISIEDSGKGIDWNAVRHAAEKKGLPAGTRDALIDAIFTDGVTTRDGVSDTSGRGVGLAAVRAACEASGGKIEVSATERQGTRLTFRWRRELVFRPSTQAPPRESRAPVALPVQRGLSSSPPAGADWS